MTQMPIFYLMIITTGFITALEDVKNAGKPAILKIPHIPDPVPIPPFAPPSNEKSPPETHSIIIRLESYIRWICMASRNWLAFKLFAKAMQNLLQESDIPITEGFVSILDKTFSMTGNERSRWLENLKRVHSKIAITGVLRAIDSTSNIAEMAQKLEGISV
ncbi:hypothetical protein AA313_de0204444 [Arthrobotrys entomopaga]|nr:hypothetical protein AA313_de0204444 [Arthrobotrys entomopaga]